MLSVVIGARNFDPKKKKNTNSGFSLIRFIHFQICKSDVAQIQQKKVFINRFNHNHFPKKKKIPLYRSTLSVSKLIFRLKTETSKGLKHHHVQIGRKNSVFLFPCKLMSINSILKVGGWGGSGVSIKVHYCTSLTGVILSFTRKNFPWDFQETNYLQRIHIHNNNNYIRFNNTYH